MRTEEHIAKAISSLHSEDAWQVFHEVSLERHLRDRHELGDARTDIVALKPHCLRVIEAKLVLGLEVLSQAKKWLPFANEVWIGIPEGKFSEVRREAYTLCREYYGIGVLEVGDGGVIERVKARHHQRRDDALLVCLDPGHQTHAAPGTNRGEYFTPFKRTAEALIEYVRRCPGESKIEDAVRLIGGHHYRTDAEAVERLTKEIKKGNVPGVRFGWRQYLEPIVDDSSQTPLESDRTEDNVARIQSNKLARTHSRRSLRGS